MSPRPPSCYNLQQAAEAGCSMLFLPENFSFMGASLAEVGQ